MLGRRLEYQSLKAVLLHMEANVRFQISLHMPSIRSVEKVVSLKIKELSLFTSFTCVNDTMYNVGIARLFPEGNVPEPIRRELSLSGSRYDFDEFGFPVASGVNVLLPGDVSFQRETHNEERNDTVEMERVYRHQLSVQENALEMRNFLTSLGVTASDYDPKLLPYCIEECKLELQPFDCRRNNTKPPFTCFIQVTITNAKKRHVEWFECNRKLFEACKHLNEVFFGGRTMPVRVGELLDIAEICRLPIGFRLTVQKLQFCGDTLTHESFPLLVENSGSLFSIHLCRDEFPLIASDCHIVRNATRLVFCYPENSDLETLAQNISELPNREMCLYSKHLSRSSEFYFSLIQAWLMAEREIGASFWIDAWNEKTLIEVLEFILTYCEKSKRTERCTSVQLSNSTALEAFYVRSERPEWFEEEDGTPGKLKMTIVEL